MSHSREHLYEFGFIAAGRRFQESVDLSGFSIDMVQGLVDQVVEQNLRLGLVQNFSMVKLETGRSGSASSIVEILQGAAEDDTIDWKPLLEAAKVVDEEAAEDPSAACYHSVRFVWNVGAGDDSLFGDGFMGIRDSVFVDQFHDELELFESNHETFYDVSVEEAGQPEASGLVEILEWSKKHPELSSLNNLLKVVRAPLKAEELDAAWASPVPSKKPGPRF